MDRRVDSFEFDISPTVYTPVLKTAFRTLYLQRAGYEKRAPFASPGFADGGSHLRKGQDPEARLFSRPKDASTERDLRGGWYDAGDYNKYTSWTANYVTSLLGAYLENPSVWTDDFGIPESGNGTPDILDEVKWGLDWLERMQNQDGAMLSVMSLDVEVDRMAKKMLQAAVHMSAMTGDAYFSAIIERLYKDVNPMDPGTVNGFEATLPFDMLYYARQSSTPRAFASRIKRDFNTQILKGYNGWSVVSDQVDPYRAHVDGYWWGSNSNKAQRGEVYTQAVHAGLGSASRLDYLNAAAGYVNYIHGVNPLNKVPIKSPPAGQPPAKSYADFNEGWPINSWSVTENSNGYQVAYLRLLSKFVR